MDKLPLFSGGFESLTLAGAILMVAGLFVCVSAEVQIYKDPAAPIDKRIDDLMKRMTLEEKLDEIHGLNFMDGRENKRLGIPPLMFTDGPHGVRENFGRNTCFPTLISAGATWNDDLIYKFGQALGEEVRGRGRNVILGPCINIHRTPLGGRNFESMAEDPYLISRLVVAYVKGVQSKKVGTSTKHFAVNNQEQWRADISVEIDERALREIYLPGFEASVKEAHTTTMMAAYNMINGDYCCENRHLLIDIAKNDWGFKDFILSDWWAIKNNIKAANSGCDMEMPGDTGHQFEREAILPAIRDGRITEATINDKVRRILRVKFELGLFDGVEKQFPGSVNTKEHQDIARNIAEEAIVLLKNTGNVLPLKKDGIKTLAVIGPNAVDGRAGGGGSSTVTPPYIVGPLEGIKKAAGGKFEVKVAKGCLMEGDIDAVLSSSLKTPDGKSGLKAEYFDNFSLNGSPKVIRTDENVNFEWGGGGPGEGIGSDNFSVRWTGKLMPKESGTYNMTLLSDDGSRMYVDGNILINSWSDHASEAKSNTIYLEKGKEYNIKIEYYEKGGDAVMKFGWTAPGSGMVAEAAELAKKCDAAVVFAGLNKQIEGEGYDKKDIFMPRGQDELILAILAANPNTIVVLINGTPLDMRKWADKVPAILEAWYPGQEGGTAIANILFGDVNPSGKLPDTFPKKLEDNPSYANYPGGNGKVYYKEGVFVGYRHYDKNNIEPMFPFGHGLSYTTFEYSGIAVTAPETKDGNYKVSVSVKNTGSREGKEVVQLYLSDKVSSVPRPPKELKGFKKISLKPGETKAVVFELNKRAFSFYDAGKRNWVAEPGEFEALVGSSSRDIRQKATINLK
ncbi:MAG: glycoside hydrolase family 3 C-terminal domain-containing protein [Elusimicrobiota bacterium]